MNGAGRRSTPAEYSCEPAGEAQRGRQHQVGSVVEPGRPGKGPNSEHVVILGAGLAGLSCAHELVKGGHTVTVLEREEQVGGMATSFVVTRDDEDGEYWCYDFGPHRFHTTDAELKDHIKEILGENWVPAKRMSRIYLKGRFFDYPLKASNVVRSMPDRKSTRLNSSH